MKLMSLLKKVFKFVTHIFTHMDEEEKKAPITGLPPSVKKEKVFRSVDKDGTVRFARYRSTGKTSDRKYSIPVIPLGDMQASAKTPKKPKKRKKKISSKLNSVFFIFLLFPLLAGCSKDQDVKIVHNYWDKTPSYAERRQTSHLDLYVCKNYKASDNGKTAVVYKVD